MGSGERRLEVGDPGVALGQFGRDPVERLVHVGHAVAAQGHRQAEPLQVGGGQRPGHRQRVGEVLGRGVLEHRAVAPTDHGKGDRRDDHDHREQQEEEHVRLPSGRKSVRVPIVSCETGG